MILIIAYGNSLRRDDAAGLVLAETLEGVWGKLGRNVKRVAVHQLTPELAEPIADKQVSAVVFVDTRVVTPRDSCLDVRVTRLPSGDPSPTLGHHMDPAALMIYARLLYGKAPPAWLVSVPGVDFGHGEGLSETARHALDNLADMLMSPPHDWLE